MAINYKRVHPWLFESSGALNPSWIIISILVILQVIITLIVIMQDSSTVKIVSISLLGVTLNIFVMAAVSQNKAAIIANARSTGDIAKGLTDILRPHGANIEHLDDSSV